MDHHHSPHRPGTLGVTVKMICALAALMIAGLNPAFAVGGDFQLDFTAAAPYTYDHTTGGGAYNDRTVGKDFDIVESLEGSDFKCGDTVSYLTQISVDDAALGSQTIEVDYEFLADTTGQSGVALADVTHVGINYGCVMNGAGAGISCDGSTLPRPEGVDIGNGDDGDSVAQLTFEGLTAPVFSKAAKLQASIQVDGLEAGETVVLRTDVMLACDPGSNPTGNLQADLISADVLVPSSGDTTIGAGNQTIPFKQIGDIDFAALSIIKTVTDQFGACPGVETLAIADGQTVKYCYEIGSVGTAPVLDLTVVDDNATPADSSDDFSITITTGLTDEDGDGSADDMAAGATVYGEALVSMSGTDGETLTNVVYANGTPVLPDEDDATVTITLQRGLNIEKRAALSGTTQDWNACADPIQAASGEDVFYCYKVTNTGDVDLYNMTEISDDNATPNDGSDDFTVNLSGLLDLDNDGLADDLASGAIAFGFSSTLSMDYAAPATRTNEAEVSADQVDPVNDIADVTIVRPAGQCSMDVSISTDGSCPAGAEVVILADSNVTWCLSVTNGIAADLDSIFVSYDINGGPATQLNTNLGPLVSGASAATQFDRLIADDSILTGSAVATDIYGNIYSCSEADANANVVHPSINLIKTVVDSADGDCANSNDPLAIVAGDEVTYCYAVTNNGDSDLVNVGITDDKLGVIDTIASLAVGETQTVTSSSVLLNTDTTNVGTASGSDANGFPVEDTDPAFVDLTYADIVVIKDATATLILNEDNTITYTIVVSNDGDATAENVVLEDFLPFGIEPLSADTRCTIGHALHTITCDLGDLASGDSTTLVFTAAAQVTSGSVTNNACGRTDTTELYLDNNCDDASTRVAPGATRTIGFWGNHPDYVEMCLEANDWQLDLGFISLSAGDDDPSSFDAMHKDTVGLLKTNIAKDQCSDKRSDVEKAQLQGGRQVVAAFCNVTMLGGSFAGVGGYSDFDAFLAAWQDASVIEQGENRKDAINQMLQLGTLADEFNNSGHDVALDSSPGRANPHFEWTDPTSPDTCDSHGNGNKPDGQSTGNGKKAAMSPLGGGCSVGTGNGFDPLLPLMGLLSLIYILRESRKKA